MAARVAALDPADVQGGSPEIHLIPTQIHELGRAQPMPEGYENHCRVAVSVAVLPCRRHQGLNLMLGQIFPAPKVGILRAPGHDCSIFGLWGDQPEAWITHINLSIQSSTVR
jgi:hypothetical protein